MTKLTIEQALKQGMAAHKEGKLQDAERLYRAILRSQPRHPDASHNLGVLAVSLNKTEAALTLFKTALEANPNVEQFWLSYIDALIKETQFGIAKQTLEKAKTQGIPEGKLKVLEWRLALIIQNPKSELSEQTKKPAFSEQRKKLSEEKKQKKKAKKQNLNSNNPSQEQLNNLSALYKNRRFSEARKLAKFISQEFPNHQFAWKVLGAVSAQTGKTSEALDANQTAVVLIPQDFEAHSNLGHTLNELGRLDEAETSFNHAIKLKPDYPEAHYNLGNTLNELGRLDEAETSFKQAIKLRPDFALAHNNLGNTLKRLGRADEAVASFSQSVDSKPDFAEAYVNLGITIKNVKFISSNRKLYPALIQLLTTGNFVRPRDVAPSILSLLKHDPLIKDLLLEKNFTTSLRDAISTIQSLEKLPLLHHLMRACPLPDLLFERLFVAMRSFLLKNLDKMEVSSELSYFLSTLSLHCFINEYIYAESDEEICLVEKLEKEIFQTITQSEQPELIKILCLATYRPLHQYSWCQKLEALSNLKELKARLIEEPLAEKMIAKNITVLGEISDNVSCKVREQYEDNPYPRWIKLGIVLKREPISKVCNNANLHLHSENIKKVTTPAILIAGCGTGQHSIETASRFSNCHVTAVDLSLTSLAYAWRKTNELGLDNLKYLQADILQLHQIGKKFDIIESSGVLHHMDEPMAGWKVLVDLLKPSGLMKIGLYSELARSQIVKVREEIASLGIGTSESEIRNFRQHLAESHDKTHQLLTTSSDFFSLSMLRDSIFHVQEHRFTLPQIKNCLDELELKFCGFEVKGISSQFKDFHGKASDIHDLVLWQEFEESNPHAFAGMYQFWCQKL